MPRLRGGGLDVCPLGDLAGGPCLGRRRCSDTVDPLGGHSVVRQIDRAGFQKVTVALQPLGQEARDLLFAGACCLPKGSSYSQVLAVFLAHARSHPAQWHEHAAPQFQLALMTAFPCKDEYPAPRADEPARAFPLPEHKP